GGTHYDRRIVIDAGRDDGDIGDADAALEEDAALPGVPDHDRRDARVLDRHRLVGRARGELLVEEAEELDAPEHPTRDPAADPDVAAPPVGDRRLFARGAADVDVASASAGLRPEAAADRPLGARGRGKHQSRRDGQERANDPRTHRPSPSETKKRMSANS